MHFEHSATYYANVSIFCLFFCKMCVGRQYLLTDLMELIKFPKSISLKEKNLNVIITSWFSGLIPHWSLLWSRMLPGCRQPLEKHALPVSNRHRLHSSPLQPRLRQKVKTKMEKDNKRMMHILSSSCLIITPFQSKLQLQQLKHAF